MNIISSIVVFLFLGKCSHFSSHACSTNVITVNTTSGSVQGTVIKTINDISVSEFLGIPFAEPPIGNLRFKPPVKVTRSNTTIIANERSKACLQVARVAKLEKIDISFYVPVEDASEDCLYLNLWAPNPEPENAAVMIWIHGGGYEAGTANSFVYDGQVLASTGVIIVAMNYRLSCYGFLYGDSIEAPGNVGLMDQALAMKWVQENIVNFGGNPLQVTIFGESAGAGSVAHHMLIPSSQGLFQKTILESGSATLLWSYIDQDRATYVFRKLLNATGCNLTSNEESVDCLRNIQAINLSRISLTFEVEGVFAPFAPTVDFEYYPADPHVLLTQGNFSKDIDIIVGIQKDDGAVFLTITDTLPDTEDAFVDEKTFVSVAKQFTGSNNDELANITKLLYAEYDNRKQPVNWRRPLVNLANDIFMDCGANILADSASLNGNKVYYYQFNHKTSVSLMPSWIGATHTEEIAYVFGQPILNKTAFTHQETILSEKIISFWTEFAKKGNPNTNSTLPKWPLYTYDEMIVFILDLKDGIQIGVRLQTCFYLNVVLPGIIKALECSNDTMPAKLNI